MLTENDLIQLAERGMTPQAVESQLERFKTGFPYLKLKGSATPGAGITVIDDAMASRCKERWAQYLADGGDVVKFVPASGAASRMFKDLFAFVNGADDVPRPGSSVAQIIDNIGKLPFKAELDAVLTKRFGADAIALRDAGKYKDIIAAIVGEDGMNYGALPKGLLTFHKYDGDETRTPLEEQLVEGAQTAATNGIVKVHFTVSDNHKALFEKKIREALPALEKRFGVKYDISMSVQKPSTDTVAVNLDNTPFRDDNGRLVFRPGGHGALIENLNDIDSTVVFVKNIDNVVPDSRREVTIEYKQVLGGMLMLVRDRIAEYMAKLNTGNYTIDDIREMIGFMHDTLNVRDEELKNFEDGELALYLKGKFDRPLRVCGMVRNEGEPGGGPFLAFNKDGSSSPQILESTQIDTTVEANREMLASATHFNPVDLVCCVRDVDGNHYDLRRYVDHETGFISEKSLGGRELRALELPGLWNGAMSDWSTVFVEVPAMTFNPVKTVNDLLRPVHQPAE